MTIVQDWRLSLPENQLRTALDIRLLYVYAVCLSAQNGYRTGYSGDCVLLDVPDR